jgi:acyl-CoA thioester hydrolase
VVYRRNPAGVAWLRPPYTGSMAAIYEYEHTVRPDEIDSLGHANNVVYVEWMQAAALAHSGALGWPAERYFDLGLGWVVRGHTIEYLQPAFAGDRVVVRTWVATMRKATSLRRYQICRKSDEEVLATAETRWAFIDYRTRQPARIPREVADSFPIAEEACRSDRTAGP